MPKLNDLSCELILLLLGELLSEVVFHACHESLVEGREISDLHLNFI